MRTPKSSINSGHHQDGYIRVPLKTIEKHRITPNLMGYPTKFDGLSSSISNLIFWGGRPNFQTHQFLEMRCPGGQPPRNCESEWKCEVHFRLVGPKNYGGQSPKLWLHAKKRNRAESKLNMGPAYVLRYIEAAQNSFHYIQKNTKWWLGLSRPLVALGAAHFPEVYSTLAALSGCPMIPSQRWGSTSQHPVPSVTCAASSLAQWQLWF